MDEKTNETTEEMAVHPSLDLANLTVTASDGTQVPHMQGQVLLWCREKVRRARVEAEELEESQTIAIENGFKRHAFENAAKRARKMVVYYEKILAALEAGYCIFPSTDCSVFAVRTKRKNPDYQGSIGSTWGGDREDRQVSPGQLPEGEGRYVDAFPVVYQQPTTDTIKRPDGTTEVVDRLHFHSGEFADVTFPFEMAKPEILRVTSEAMALKVFDEMGIVEPGRALRKGDPIIVGRIVRPGRPPRVVSFLVAWLISTRDL